MAQETMTIKEATEIATEWHKGALSDQTLAKYIESLHRRYCSTTASYIDSDVVTVVTAMKKFIEVDCNSEQDCEKMRERMEEDSK